LPGLLWLSIALGVYARRQSKRKEAALSIVNVQLPKETSMTPLTLGQRIYLGAARVAEAVSFGMISHKGTMLQDETQEELGALLLSMLDKSSAPIAREPKFAFIK